MEDGWAKEAQNDPVRRPIAKQSAVVVLGFVMSDARVVSLSIEVACVESLTHQEERRLARRQPQDCSHDADLVGNLEGLEVVRELHVGLLVTSGGDQSVDLLDLNSVELLDGRLDGGLVSLLLDDENESVAVLNVLDLSLIHI